MRLTTSSDLYLHVFYYFSESVSWTLLSRLLLRRLPPFIPPCRYILKSFLPLLLSFPAAPHSRSLFLLLYLLLPPSWLHQLHLLLLLLFRCKYHLKLSPAATAALEEKWKKIGQREGQSDVAAIWKMSVNFLVYTVYEMRLASLTCCCSDPVGVSVLVSSSLTSTFTGLPCFFTLTAAFLSIRTVHVHPTPPLYLHIFPGCSQLCSERNMLRCIPWCQTRWSSMTLHFHTSIFSPSPPAHYLYPHFSSTYFSTSSLFSPAPLLFLYTFTFPPQSFHFHLLPTLSLHQVVLAQSSVWLIHPV